LLHRVNNCLKHNPLSACETSAKSFPENVGIGKRYPYEKGMFAEDWIILKESPIANFFD